MLCSKCTGRRSDACCAALIGCQNRCQNKLAAYRWQFIETDANGMRCANGPCTCCLSCSVFLLGQLDAASCIDPEIERQRLFGDVFFIGGKLTVASTDEVHRRLLGAMDRGFYIGKPNVDPRAMTPRFPRERLFPLAMASGGCPMNDGSHRAFRTQFARYCMNAETMARLSTDGDVLSVAIEEVRAAAAATKGEYTGPLKEACLNYVVRAIFWAVFHIDLGERDGAEYKAVRWACSALNAVVQNYILNQSTGAPQIARIFEMVMGSGALAGYELDEGLTRCPSKERFVSQLLPVLFIAALQGVPTLLAALFTDQSGTANRYGGVDSAWRKGRPRSFPLPVGERQRMRLVVLETARLNPPVPETVSVLPAPESFHIKGVGAKTFPAGCPVLLSFANTALDPATYANPTRFDPYGHADALKTKFNGFNGVGDQGDRICPGRDLSIEILIDVLEAVSTAGGPAAAAV